MPSQVAHQPICHLCVHLTAFMSVYMYDMYNLKASCVFRCRLAFFGLLSACLQCPQVVLIVIGIANFCMFQRSCWLATATVAASILTQCWLACTSPIIVLPICSILCSNCMIMNVPTSMLTCCNKAQSGALPVKMKACRMFLLTCDWSPATVMALGQISKYCNNL